MRRKNTERTWAVRWTEMGRKIAVEALRWPTPSRRWQPGLDGVWGAAVPHGQA
jgi:hypothetical protein